MVKTVRDLYSDLKYKSMQNRLPFPSFDSHIVIQLYGMNDPFIIVLNIILINLNTEYVVTVIYYHPTSK